MLRDWGTVSYLPILGLRPAEMRALEELPNQTKDMLFPLVPLRPWVGAHHLQSAIDRIRQSYGERPVIVSVGDREVPRSRPVFEQLEALRNPANGFARWCEFIDNNPLYVPVVQLGIDANQEPRQIEQLLALGRGLVLHIERPAFGSLRQVSEILSARVGGQSEQICIIIDFGTAGVDHLNIAAQVVGFIETIRAALPHVYICISASSFPSSFSNLTDQPIYERRLFEAVAPQIPTGRLIYGDRGSARAEQLSGGSGVIPSRIDYPMFNDWRFFRSEETGFNGYVEQALSLINSDVWNSELRVWGTQMIERTAREDHSAIDTP